ncbi:MAG TPA: PQQ-binding-like beta-propeller repeat protein [Thermoanaerobaculia bacterium]|nr:PQQ-binding-like beta-propeller repeat protein [Thermoanaerobaculia bacterium]
MSDDTRSHARLCLLPALVSILVLTPPTLAADWPQIGGPTRDFVVPGARLATTWPADGPRVLWRRPLGPGYSGITVVGDRLFTMVRTGERESVVALRMADGSELWRHTYDAPIDPEMAMEHGTGPHATPLHTSDGLYTLGVRGKLLALDPASGAVRWQRELVTELGAPLLDRGHAASALAWGDNLIVPLGGESRAVAAFARASGELVWRSADFANSYSSPTLIQLGGRPLLLLFGSDGLLGLDPDNGRVLWTQEHPTMYGLNISMPVFVPAADGSGVLFLSSAYDGGSRALRIRRQEDTITAEELWANKQMRLHIGNAIVQNGTVYASSGDFGAVPLAAASLSTGEILWRDRAFARAGLVLAGDKLLVLDEDGVLGLATASPAGLTVHAKVDLFQTRVWTPPTLVGRTVLARDQEDIVALELP